jgi:hypothetical protein
LRAAASVVAALAVRACDSERTKRASGAKLERAAELVQRP